MGTQMSADICPAAPDGHLWVKEDGHYEAEIGPRSSLRIFLLRVFGILLCASIFFAPIALFTDEKGTNFFGRKRVIRNIYFEHWYCSRCRKRESREQEGFS